MTPFLRFPALSLFRLAAVITVATGSGQAQVTPAIATRIDNVFKRFTQSTPGCALLVRKDGATLYSHSSAASLSCRSSQFNDSSRDATS
jgi:hypothetical protein